MNNCSCIHEPACHESVTGACLAVNPIYGACPCAATPDNVRAVLDYVAQTHLNPEYQRLQREVRNIRKEYHDLTGLFSKLLHGTDDELAEIRRQIAMADRLLAPNPEQAPSNPDDKYSRIGYL